MSMRPTQLPELRQDVLDAYRSTAGQQNWMATNGQQGFLGHPANEARCREALQHEVQRWAMGDLYFVTAEMTALAQEAAKTIPTFSLLPSDLPSSHGVIYFERGVGNSRNSAVSDLTAPIVAVAWGPITVSGLNTAGVHEARRMVWLSFYTDAGELDRRFAAENLPVGQHREFLSRMANLGPLRYDNEVALPFTTDPNLKPMDIQPHLGKDTLMGWPFVVLTSWLLMQQPVTRITEEVPDRPARRRLARRGVKDLEPVRVVTLRHQSAPGPGDGDREYHHRWLVKGHWRNQWYSSQERHIPIWISPHIKGPEGAPLLGGEKVYAWTR